MIQNSINSLFRTLTHSKFTRAVVEDIDSKRKDNELVPGAKTLTNKMAREQSEKQEAVRSATEGELYKDAYEHGQDDPHIENYFKDADAMRVGEDTPHFGTIDTERKLASGIGISKMTDGKGGFLPEPPSALSKAIENAQRSLGDAQKQAQTKYAMREPKGVRKTKAPRQNRFHEPKEMKEVKNDGKQ